MDHINEALVALGVLIIGSIGTLLTVWVQRIKRDLERNTEITRQTREAANGTLTTALDRLNAEQNRVAALRDELSDHDDRMAYILSQHPEVAMTLTRYRDRRNHHPDVPPAPDSNYSISKSFVDFLNFQENTWTDLKT